VDATAQLSAALAGRYSIERELGEGGMATVYLAHDVKHGRKVALKVLKPDLAAALGAERFLAEIKTTANLQHPHVVSLHDSGDADGFLYYVMPFVEGESLRDRLIRERLLPVDDALRIAREVADALQYAHTHGVVHRDIKPENILLETSGHAMVADFGIALAVQQAGTARMTQTGLSLGTPQYMSPEQAMGERVIDARSDIYALASIVYEMLTGEPPFTGATLQAIVARLLTEAPRPIIAQRKSVPPHIEAAVMKALEKVPADRFASARDFAAALSGEQRVIARSGVTRTRSISRNAISLLASFLALAVIAPIIWRYAARPAGPPPLLTARIASSADGPSDLGQVALSPDGATLAYVSSTAVDGGRIWLRRMSDRVARPIAETEGARQPFWAPDGSALGYYAAGSLRTVNVATGAVRTLAPAPNPAPGAAWSARGIILYSPFFNGLWTVPASGGPPKRLAGLSKDDRDPSMLPDGHHFLYWRTGQVARTAALAVGDVETNQTRVLAENISHAVYVAPGYVLFFQESAQASLEQPAPLLAQRFNARRVAFVGEPVTLSARVERPFEVPIVSATTDYVVIREAGAPADARTRESIYWLDRSTGRTMPVNGAGPAWTFRISHDGRRVAMGGAGLWLYDPARDVSVRVPTKTPAPWPPVWSPDDHAIATVNAANISVIPVDGGAAERVLKASDDPAWADPVDWSLDGSTIYYVREPSEQRPQWELWRDDLATAKNEHVPTGPGNLMDARVSPDSKWIAWESDASGRREIYLGPASGTATPLRVSKSGGGSPRWRGDGRELFFIGGDGRIGTATNPTFVRGAGQNVINGIDYQHRVIGLPGAPSCRPPTI